MSRSAEFNLIAEGNFGPGPTGPVAGDHRDQRSPWPAAQPRRTVLLVADDLGLNPGVNEAVFRAHREGGLHAASLMPGQPATEAAVGLAKACPTLRVGWHLHLCDSRPLTRGSWPWGSSPLRAALAMTGWPSARRLVRRELRRQWTAWSATGLTCAFVNGHHHLHLHPVVLRELEALIPRQSPCRPWLRGFHLRPFGSRRFWGVSVEQRLSPLVSLWLRRRAGWTFSDSLWGLDRLQAMEAQEVLHAMPGLSDGLHEFLFHPRSATDADPDFRALIGLRSVRLAEPSESQPFAAGA